MATYASESIELKQMLDTKSYYLHIDNPQRSQGENWILAKDIYVKKESTYHHGNDINKLSGKPIDVHDDEKILYYLLKYPNIKAITVQKILRGKNTGKYYYWCHSHIDQSKIFSIDQWENANLRQRLGNFSYNKVNNHSLYIRK